MKPQEQVMNEGGGQIVNADTDYIREQETQKNPMI